MTRSLTPPEYERFSTITNSIEEHGIHAVTIDQICNWITDAYMHEDVAQKVLEYLRKRLNTERRISRIRNAIERAQPLRRRAGYPILVSKSEAIIVKPEKIAQLTQAELEDHLETVEKNLKLPSHTNPIFKTSVLSYINHAAKGTLDILQIAPLDLLNLILILDTPPSDISPKPKQRDLIVVLQATIVNHNLKYNTAYNQIKHDPEQNAALETTDNILNTYYEKSGRERPVASLIPAKKSLIQRWFTRHK
jgi:hypothetical protein